MASALGGDSSKTWWTLTKSSRDLPKQKITNDKYSFTASKNSGRSFPSFASVIGLKPKKQHPSLAIQDPPPPLLQPHSPSHPSNYQPEYPSRLYQAKAPTQPLSPANSIGPVTPVDAPRQDAQSILAALDPDPFAARGVVVRSPSYTNRFSAHSNSSFLEVGSKQEKPSLLPRGSYSSMSSNSHSSVKDQANHSPLNLHDNPADLRTLGTSRSMGNLRRQPTLSIEPPLPNLPQTLINAQDKRLPPSLSRSTTRSRGMTEGSVRAPFPQEEHPAPKLQRPPPSRQPSQVSIRTGTFTAPTSSRPSPVSAAQSPMSSPVINQVAPPRIVRQGSRTHLPPTAPPRQDLPAPPMEMPEELKVEGGSDVTAARGSGSVSSSSISFASSISSTEDIIQVHLDTQRLEKKDFSSNTSSPLNVKSETEMNNNPTSPCKASNLLACPRSLKKAISQSSLSSLAKRPRTPSTQSSINQPPGIDAEKVARKQRCHHRLPIPPLPLGLKHVQSPSNGSFISSQTTEPQGSTIEQRRGSVTSNASIPVRKRVFSGSSLLRPSTSSGYQSMRQPEDDQRSLFSVRSDRDILSVTSAFNPWPAAISASTSFWDETPDQSPASPARPDFQPKAIISPEDIAKVEAGIDDFPIKSPSSSSLSIRTTRERKMSASTLLSDRDSEVLPMSVFSSPASGSVPLPQNVASPASPASFIIGARNEPNTGISRTLSLANRPSVPPLRLSHRPRTASGATQMSSLTPMSPTQGPRPSTASSASVPASPPTPTSTSASIILGSPTKKAPRKNSRGSNPPSAFTLRSLPPPPRPRHRAEIVVEPLLESPLDVEGTVVAHNKNANVSNQLNNDAVTAKLAPPTLQRTPSFQRPNIDINIHRASALRRPSFLDIDDDDDDDDDDGMAQEGEINHESFLEFGRESFDTVRSADFGSIF